MVSERGGARHVMGDICDGGYKGGCVGGSGVEVRNQPRESCAASSPAPVQLEPSPTRAVAIPEPQLLPLLWGEKHGTVLVIDPAIHCRVCPETRLSYDSHKCLFIVV